MTTTTDIGRHAPPAANVSGTSGATTRDPRLDVFRGISMFVILISHAPGNPWSNWIWGRFGFSDAAEVFVFCSGMASAVAFGGTFDRAGWTLGTARVAFRVWQVYWAHIGLFLVIAFAMAALNAAGFSDKNYIFALNLQRFFEETGPQLLGLMTLTYVPNFFDILPMYIVLLMMIPLVMALHRLSPLAALAALASLWLATQLGRDDFAGTMLGDTFGLRGFPAEPWSDRVWFFNPFGWQIVFFTGFALMKGWIPAPPVTPWLIALASAVVLVSVPIVWWPLRGDYPLLRDIWDAIEPLRPKTEEGILRYVHLLSLAYLAWAAAGRGGHRLMPHGQSPLDRARDGTLAIITRVGQQSLAVFMVSMLGSRLMGVLLDETVPAALVNILGIATLIATAYTVAWFKSQPWRVRRSIT